MRVARIYDAPGGDGFRVLVDRLWPRGISRDRLRLDEWAKDLAPSTELRRWYGHDPARFEEFARRYLDELNRPDARAALERVAEAAGDGELVLLTATRDVEHSGAVVLRRRLVEP